MWFICILQASQPCTTLLSQTFPIASFSLLSLSTQSRTDIPPSLSSGEYCLSLIIVSDGASELPTHSSPLLDRTDLIFNQQEDCYRISLNKCCPLLIATFGNAKSL